MLLNIDELIVLLREGVYVQDPSNPEELDEAYLSMTDSDLELFIKLGASRAYPNVVSLNDLPNGSEYPVVLLAKIELYLKLAVARADKVDMSADGASISLSQRFEHYMSLVEACRAQYNDWLENEGQGQVQSYDVLLDSRHYTSFNYERQPKPMVYVSLDEVSFDTVKFHWTVSDTTKFDSYKVYISTTPILDMHKEGADYTNKLCGEPTLIVSTKNMRDNYHSLTGLQHSTSYYLCVISLERNRVFGYKELMFNTLVKAEKDVKVSSL